MSLTEHSSRLAGSKPAAVPFGGLGFSLDAVRETARSLTIAPLPAAVPGGERSASRNVPRLSGYALLTALGREIRGR